MILTLYWINKHLALIARPVSLEVDPFPALAGNSVTLRCLVWGTDQISQAGFYVNASKLLESRTPTYQIPSVTKSARGSYKCHAVFTYTGSSEEETESNASDDQVLEVYGTDGNFKWQLRFLAHPLKFHTCDVLFQKFRWERCFPEQVTAPSPAPAPCAPAETRLNTTGTASTKAAIAGRWCWKTPVGRCGPRRLAHTRAEQCGKMEGLSAAEAVSPASQRMAPVDRLIVITAHLELKMPNSMPMPTQNHCWKNNKKRHD